MQTENNKPLYKMLNENRTQGEWQQFSKKTNCASLECEEGTLCTFNFGNTKFEKEKDIINARYTALAVNNFHKLAEALEAIINCAFTNNTNTVEIGKSELRKAKEALKAIS